MSAGSLVQTRALVACLGALLAAAPSACLLTIDDQKLDATDGGHPDASHADVRLDVTVDQTALDGPSKRGDAGHDASEASSEAGDVRDGAEDGRLAAATCEAVADFVVASSSAAKVSLSWRGAPGVTVTVARKTYCGNDSYIILATLPAGASSYTDDTVEAGWNYWYEVVASDGSDAGSSVALATQAAVDAANGCAGGKTPQPSGVAPGGACSANADSGVHDP
jgi:hypothetical protein